MRINVAQLLKQPIGVTRRYEIEEVSEEGFPIQGGVELLRTNRSILVRGTLKTALGSVCSRCLEEFDCLLTLELEEEFYPTKDIVTGVPLPVPQDMGAFTIDDEHVLDLSEAVRQYALLSAPMKPLCRPQCLGLCPYCGCNLNYGSCDCTLRPADSRWAKLEDLTPGGVGRLEKELENHGFTQEKVR